MLTCCATPGFFSVAAECVACPALSTSPPGSDVRSNCSCISGATGYNGAPCVSCVAGKYKVAPGSAFCSACEGGKYSNAIAATSADTCISCPPDSTSKPGSNSSSRCVCNVGFDGPGGGPPCEPMVVTVCGNGIWTTGEGCDDGNSASNDGCSSTCTVECGFDCGTAEPSVCESTCGDGYLASDELCDDGNADDNDGCSSTCSVEPGYQCDPPAGCGASTCVWLTGNEVCGDGLTLGSEIEMVNFCDDGGNSGGDGCSSTCKVECGYECTGGTSTSADECTSVCGDGIKTASEQCDDNNSNDNDGCDSACFIEAGYTCSTPDCALSYCDTVCGDGCVCFQIFFIVFACLLVYLHACMCTCMHAYIHTCMRACMHAYQQLKRLCCGRHAAQIVRLPCPRLQLLPARAQQREMRRHAPGKA